MLARDTSHTQPWIALMCMIDFKNRAGYNIDLKGECNGGNLLRFPIGVAEDDVIYVSKVGSQ